MDRVVNSQALIIARESRGKSQGEVAQATGVSQGHISKAENDVYNPNPEQIQKIQTIWNIQCHFSTNRDISEKA